MSAAPPVLLGIVMPDLDGYRRLVNAVCEAECVRNTDFTITAPLYKGSPRIVEELKAAHTGLERFEVYFRCGVADEPSRQQMAQAFRRQYLAARPRSEGQDVYLASGDVLVFSFELHAPSHFPDKEKAFKACRDFSHDPAALQAATEGKQLDRSLLTGRLKVFLEGPANTRRMEIPGVQKLVQKRGMTTPHVFELAIQGGLPGLFVCAVEPLARELGGGMALLPG